MLSGNGAADAFSINSVVFKRTWTFPKETRAKMAKISLQATGKCTFLFSPSPQHCLDWF